MPPSSSLRRTNKLNLTHLSRKAAATCTLSLANVSASPMNMNVSTNITNMSGAVNTKTMQVELKVDFSSVISIPIPVEGADKKTARRRAGQIHQAQAQGKNMIPFPTTVEEDSDSDSSSSSSWGSDSSSSSVSSSTSYSSSSSVSGLSPHALLRTTVSASSRQPHVQSQVPGQGRRTRKSSLAPSTTSSAYSHTLTPASTSRSIAKSKSSSSQHPMPPAPVSGFAPSPISLRVQAERELQTPERPASPAPTPGTNEQQDIVLGLSEMQTTQLMNDIAAAIVDKVDKADPPPYSFPPPPYTASPTDVKQVVPLRVVSPTPTHAKGNPVSSRTPAAASSTPSRIPLPVSSQQPSSQSQPRRPRISSSELKLLVYLYRTIMYGVEIRHRADMAQAQARARSVETGARATLRDTTLQKGFGRFPLVEDDNDNDDRDIIQGAFGNRTQRRASAAAREHHAQFDVQDALLAIRLRGFLKMQGVRDEELMLDGYDSSSESDQDENLNQNEVLDDNDNDNDTGKRPIRSSPPPISPSPSPPPNSKSMKNRVLPPSYMIAFLTLRHHMAPTRRTCSKRASGEKQAASGYNAYGSGHGRKSGLRTCSWIASPIIEDDYVVESGCEGAKEEEEITEVDEEFDCASLVDYYV